jgi:hypothetical protein
MLPTVNDTCIPLSNVDIKYILNSHGVKVKFLLYKNISKIKDLNRHLPCFILVQHHKNIGHWVCLFKNDEGLNYFDPLGFLPDKLLEPQFFDNDRIATNSNYTYLLQKIYDTGKSLIYNDYNLQNPNSMCCGYWVVFRLLNQHIKQNDFVKIFKNEKNRDFTIVEIIKKLI